MKAVGRWIAKVFGGALTLVLFFAMLPHVSRIVARIMPDETGAAIKASAIIASRLEESARLETFKVEEEGVLNYDIQAAFIGSVGNISVRYTYAGSFGIDLKKVQMQLEGNAITFRLPAAEVLQDSLTAVESHREDFWYPGFSDDDYAKLLEDERCARREAQLTGEKGQQLADVSKRMFENTIAAWIQRIDGDVDIRFEWIEEE